MRQKSLMDFILRAKRKARAQIRHTKKGVLVLCDIGHIIDSHPKKYMAGSMFESELSFRHYGDRFDRLAWACKGAGHKRRKRRK